MTKDTSKATTGYKFYLDQAASAHLNATTEIAISPFLFDYYGNPSSIHSEGRKARQAIDSNRKVIAMEINCRPEEIVFTSGGTEGDNMCIKGYAFANKDKGNRIIISCFEHPAVYETARWLMKFGFIIDIVCPNNKGVIEPEYVANMVTDETILVSIMLVNNEIGTVQPVEAIAEAVKKKNPNVAMHTDAVQGFTSWFPDMSHSNIDMFTVSGHKLGAMKGTGFCYIRKGISIEPLLHGGGQEFGLRSGTENTIGITSLGSAVCSRISSINKQRLVDVLWNAFKDIDGCYKVADSDMCPNIAAFQFEDVDATELVLLLSEEGIMCSAGSACHALSGTYSATLEAIDLTPKEASEVVRFSTSKYLTAYDAKTIGKIVKKCVDEVRGHE